MSILTLSSYLSFGLSRGLAIVGLTSGIVKALLPSFVRVMYVLLFSNLLFVFFLSTFYTLPDLLETSSHWILLDVLTTPLRALNSTLEAGVQIINYNLHNVSFLS